MRKLFTFLLILVSVPVFCVNITFNVKMSGQDLPKDTVYIVGFVTDWVFEPMFEIGDSLYSWSVDLEPGTQDAGVDSLAFYFITVNSWDSAGNEDWNYYRQFREWFDTTCSQSFPLRYGTDRWVIVPQQDTTITAYFGKCPDYSPTSGINDYKNDFNFYVFPNPATSNVTVRLPELNGNINVKIFDVSGKIMLEKSTLNMTEINLQTGMLPKGVYMIQVNNNSFTSIQKLLIK